MNANYKEEVVSAIRNELFITKPQLSKQIDINDHLISQWGMESLDMVELVARIEARFQAPIDDNNWKSLVTIEKIADYILAHVPTERFGIQKV